MNEDAERCMEMAAPLLPEFHAAWYAAVAKYADYEAEHVAEHRIRTAASAIFDHMAFEIESRFRGKPGCALLDVRGMQVLNYRDQIVWRHKKVNNAGRHQNARTKQQREYDARLPLPGIPEPAIRLVCGYEPDITHQAIKRIIVARPYKRSVEWAVQVNIVDSKATWTEITPQRLTGTERFQPKKSGER